MFCVLPWNISDGDKYLLSLGLLVTGVQWEKNICQKTETFKNSVFCNYRDFTLLYTTETS